MLSARVAHTEARRQAMRDTALRLYLDDWTMREIAQELGATYSTVNAYIHEALRQIGPSQDTRRLRDNKVDQLLRLSKSLLPAAMGEGWVRTTGQDGDVVSVEVTFGVQQAAAKTWLAVVDRLVKVSGMDEVKRVDASAARAEPESMGLYEVDKELAEFAESLRLQPGAGKRQLADPEQLALRRDHGCNWSDSIS